MKQLLLPLVPALEHSPELAPLAILDTALLATERALLAVYPEVYHGLLDRSARGSTPLRANAIILQGRRLAAGIAAYRHAAALEARRAERALRHVPF